MYIVCMQEWQLEESVWSTELHNWDQVLCDFNPIDIYEDVDVKKKKKNPTTINYVFPCVWIPKNNYYLLKCIYLKNVNK